MADGAAQRAQACEADCDLLLTLCRARDRLPCPLNRHLVALAVLFGRQAEMALQIVDKGQVSKAVGRESRREVFHVRAGGSRRRAYRDAVCTHG